MKSDRCFLGLLLILLVGCGGSNSPVEDSRKHFRMGQDYLNQYNLDAATKEFKYALHLNPNFTEAYYALGVTQQRMGMLDEAKGYFETYLSYHPEHKDTQMHLFDIYYESRLVDEAIQKGQAILEYDPNNAHVHDILGRIFLYNKADYLAAKYHYTQLAQNESTAQEANFKLVEISQNMNQMDEAEAILRQILAKDPANLKAYNKLIKICEDSGRTGDLIQLYEKVIELQPKDQIVRVTLMELYVKQNLLDKAEALAIQLLQMDPLEINANFVLGKVYFTRGEYEKALEQFRITRKASFKSNDTLEYLANICYRFRKWDEAEDAYKVLLIGRPDLFEARLNLTMLYLRTKKWQMAESSANELVYRFHGFDEAYLYLGLALFQQGNTADSISNLQKFFNPVSKVSPTYQLFFKRISPQMMMPRDYKLRNKWYEVVGHYILGFCYLLQEQPEAAVKQFSLAVQSVPGFVEPYIASAIACHESGQYQKAHEFARKALDLAPDDPLISLIIANIYASQGDLTNAQKYMKKANGAIEQFNFPMMDITKNISPGKPASLSHLSLGIFCYQHGLRDKAVEECKYVLKYSPENPLARYIVDNIYILMVRYYKESESLRVNNSLNKILDLPVMEDNLKEGKG